MSKLDPSKLDLSLYPLVGTYQYPSHAGLEAALLKGLGLPAGVRVSDAPRGASWCSLVTVSGGAPPTKELTGRLRVHGLQPDKKLGEALIVSFVLLDGDLLVAASEDHAFKPPRPARLAVVDASDALVPITDAIRAAIEAVSTGATKPAKASKSDAKASESDAKASKSDAKASESAAKASKSAAKASKSDAKASKGKATNEPSERFVFEFPLFRLVASPRGERLATVHMGSRHVRLWDLEGRALGQLDIGGNGTVVPQAAAFSPDGARLATGVKELRVADGTTGAELARVEIATKAEINDVVWREDGLFVTALTPKTIVLVHVDPSSFAKRTVYEHKREPGMPGSPLLDGAIGWMAVSGEARLLCLDLATGKTVRHELGDRFEGDVSLEGVAREGLWVRAQHGLVRPLHLLDRATLATLRTWEVSSPGSTWLAPGGSGFFTEQSDEEGEAHVVWHDERGQERMRFGHPDVPGLAERLATLAKARANKESLSDLVHEARHETQAIAFAGDMTVLASEWAIAVRGRDGSLCAITTG